MSEDRSQVVAFFDGKTVLLTGATGFIGKVILAKLLLSAPGVKRVLLLVRPGGRGESAQQRVDKTVFGSVLFRTVLKGKEALKNKVQIIEGDMAQLGLSLSTQDVALVQDEVNVIIHAAASIKFTEGLKSIVRTNTVGSLQLLELAKTCKHLQSHVHISTIFTNSIRGPSEEIQERIYQLPFNASAMLDRILKMTDAEEAREAPQIVGKWPNAYSVAKAMAEVLLCERKEHVPLTIIRPPVVSACGTDILPGWIDSLAGATFFIRGNALGYMRVLPGTHQLICDLFPVDTLASGVLCAAWATAHGKVKPKSGNVPIYHFSSSTMNPIQWARILDETGAYFARNPPRGQIRKPFSRWIQDPAQYQAIDMALNHMSSILLDMESTLAGKRTAIAATDAKLRASTQTLSYYIANEWFFNCDNVLALIASLSEDDKRVFQMDVRCVDWKAYLATYAEGVHRYIFNEKAKAGAPLTNGPATSCL